MREHCPFGNAGRTAGVLQEDQVVAGNIDRRDTKTAALIQGVSKGNGVFKAIIDRRRLHASIDQVIETNNNHVLDRRIAQSLWQALAWSPQTRRSSPHLRRSADARVLVPYRVGLRSPEQHRCARYPALRPETRACSATLVRHGRRVSLRASVEETQRNHAIAIPLPRRSCVAPKLLNASRSP